VNTDPDTPHIDPYLFERQFDAFKALVQEMSGVFVSFGSNPYVRREEGYKSEIHRKGSELLNWQAWKLSDVGTGRIATQALASIEPSND